MLSWPDGLGGHYILIKTLLDVYLLPSNLAVYDTRRRNGNGSVHFGVYPCTMFYMGVLYIHLTWAICIAYLSGRHAKA